MTNGILIKESMRINKYLALCGVASRRKAEEFVTGGLVKVNDQICTNLATDILETDKVELNGKIVKPCENFEYYMLNKPKGYVSSVMDDRGRKTVVSLINTNARIFPVGRLDYDSEGLLLLTNDGDLTNILTHPKHEINKTYIVKIEGDISLGEIALLEKGVTIDGNVKLGGAKVQILSHEDNQTKLSVVIHEGKNREIRKMFEVVGKQVIFLKRTQIANLKMTGLKRGEYRKLTQNEIDYLKSL